MLKLAIVNSSSFGCIYPEHLEVLKEFASVDQHKVDKFISPEEFQKILADYDGIIASTNPDYPAELLRNLHKLKVITRHGIGFNNIDIGEAQKQGIIVTKVAGPVERNSVAEHAVGLLMSAARWIPQGDRAVKDNRWKDRANYVGKEITGKTIGIIGLGNIGSRAAEILQSGFQANVLVNDPNLSPEEIETAGYKSVSLDELIKESDFISLHCAHTEATHHLLGKEEFAAMKKGVIIANAARGELVDDKAILEFLDSRHIQVYASDVIEGEPIDNTHHLLKRDNVIVVPHLGGYSDESSKGMGETMVNNMRAVFIEKRIPTESLVPGLNVKKIRS